MRIVFVLIYCFCVLKSYTQTNSVITAIKTNLEHDNNNIYILCRGTESKSGSIAKQFNITDTNITHVGLGLIINNDLRIYHVVNDNGRYKSALRVDSLESFIGFNDVFFLSIWKCNVTPKESQKIKRICKNYTERKIIFDALFNISNDDILYCSEFCVNVLKNIKKFNFKPVHIKLTNKLYESILGRKDLSYFPVDFFQTNKYFKKVFEYNLKQ